jgi:hypothetical protein
MSRKSILDLVDGDSGYTVVNAEKLRAAVLAALSDHVTGFSSTNGSIGTENPIDFIFKNHSRFQSKRSRLFSAENAGLIVSEMLRVLVEQGIDECVEVSDEEGLGHPNVYFRAVRPRHSEDVGSLHKDKWFWDLGHGATPRDRIRAKCWIPILQDIDACGLAIVPGSHRTNFDYSSRTEESTGKLKPVFDCRLVEKQVIPAPVRIGEAIVFHDELLHGGVATSHERISAEMTLLFKLLPK